MKKIQKPLPGEYPPYTLAYIDQVPDDGLLLQHLRDNALALKALVADLPDTKLSVPCSEDEWTIKEILVHIIDTERIFSYRALRFARNDSTELAGFEQDAYVANAGANARGIDNILEEFTAVRAATIALFSSLSEEAFTRSGQASGHNLSVRAAAYQIAGHELHHVESIKENYL